MVELVLVEAGVFAKHNVCLPGLQKFQAEVPTLRVTAKGVCRAICVAARGDNLVNKLGEGGDVNAI